MESENSAWDTLLDFFYTSFCQWFECIIGIWSKKVVDIVFFWHNSLEMCFSLFQKHEPCYEYFQWRDFDPDRTQGRSRWTYHLSLFLTKRNPILCQGSKLEHVTYIYIFLYLYIYIYNRKYSWYLSKIDSDCFTTTSNLFSGTLQFVN